jgi:hypothetical protein
MEERRDDARFPVGLEGLSDADDSPRDEGAGDADARPLEQEDEMGYRHGYKQRWL